MPRNVKSLSVSFCFSSIIPISLLAAVRRADRMNTPPLIVPDPPHAGDLVANVVHDNLFKRLQEVVRSREEETPEPQFPEDTEECYQWKCEELRNHFKPHEADKHRMRISQRDYWKAESIHYSDALKELMWKRARAAHGADGEPSADHWRAVAMFYRDLLQRSGLSLGQTRDIRLTIESQEYWKCEAEIYQQSVAAHEDEMREALRARDDIRRQRQTHTRHTPAQSSQRKDERNSPVEDSVATRTRSRTNASTGSGVAKPRRPRIGAKAAGQTGQR